jgi:glycosyltransferase involved in cell wall biosynthesis
MNGIVIGNWVELDSARSEVLISVVLPVFNQEDLIEPVLISLVRCMTLPFELIIINDCSTDGSAVVIEEFLAALDDPQSFLVRYLFIDNKEPKYETACDALGFGLSTGNYLLEIQADMVLKQVGFDAKLLRALEKYEDILMVSGRGTEPLAPILVEYLAGPGAVRGSGRSHVMHLLQSLPIIGFPLHVRDRIRAARAGKKTSDTSHFAFEILPTETGFNRQGGKAGRLGELIDAPTQKDYSEAPGVWLGQTVMRGPLLIHRAKYEQLGGLNSAAFFLGYDDHDLAIRAWIERGWRVGFVPVDFESRLEFGATRQKASFKRNLELYRNLKSISRFRKRTGLFKYRNVSGEGLPAAEIRLL